MDNREKIKQYYNNLQSKLDLLSEYGKDCNAWREYWSAKAHEKFFDQILKLLEPEFQVKIGDKEYYGKTMQEAIDKIPSVDRVKAIKDILYIPECDDYCEYFEECDTFNTFANCRKREEVAKQISSLPIEVELEIPNEIDYQKSINEYMKENDIFSIGDLDNHTIYEIRENKLIDSIIQQLASKGVIVKEKKI